MSVLLWFIPHLLIRAYTSSTNVLRSVLHGWSTRPSWPPPWNTCAMLCTLPGAGTRVKVQSDADETLHVHGDEPP